MARSSRFIVNRALALASSAGVSLGHDFNVAWLPRLLGYSIGVGAVVHAQALGPDVDIGTAVRIGRNVRVAPGTRIGAGSVIGEGAILGTGVVIGSGCVVGAGAHLERITLGDYTMIEPEVLCLGYGDGHITIGTESYVSPRVILDWSDNVSIGDSAHIGANVWTHTSVPQALHGDRLRDKTRRPRAPVSIGSRVLVGTNSTVYPGVTVGSGSVILPNSVVNHDVPDGVMAGGVPAKVLKEIDSRFDDDD